ncbi:MAG: hypothetical protein AB8B85_02685 [Paracoccaceae bacterium]
MANLDKSKPYATFYPVFEGATFEQNGIRYDALGKSLSEAVKEKPAKTAKQKPPKAAPAPEAAAPAPAAPVNPDVGVAVAPTEADGQAVQVAKQLADQ